MGNAEIWLSKRCEYMRSLAVMSMVGYVLGLGDRHPCNLMIHRYTGKVVHIDFGDCFEVAMLREKLPEKVPFRLTRMLINAMEISGFEGNFRINCEAVMALLREHKESVMAVLEALAYDPLMNWRPEEEEAAHSPSPLTPKSSTTKFTPDFQIEFAAETNKKEEHAIHELYAISLKKKKEKSSLQASSHSVSSGRRRMSSLWMPRELDDTADSREHVNKKALQVLQRVSMKLRGSSADQNVKEQVQQLFIDATSHENLSQAYLGWCPLW